MMSGGCEVKEDCSDHIYGYQVCFIFKTVMEKKIRRTGKKKTQTKPKAKTVLVSTSNKPLMPPAEETVKMRTKSPAGH